MKKALIIVMLFLTIMADAAFAASLNIAFTTDPQTVVPNSASEKITVQSQDPYGNSQTIGETGDLFVTSDSPTAEFSSSNTTWKAVSQLTVSKNTANRSFYYKDSAEGSFVITARLSLRTSGLSGTATQNIAIGAGHATSSNQSNSKMATVPSSATTSVASEQSDDHSEIFEISAHNSPLSTSDNLKIKQQLIADAGRERIGMVNSSLAFNAIAFDQTNKKVSGLDTTWSFGDGTSAHGESVEHAYMYPGDYVVIMNTQKGDLVAVDRTLVHVMPSSLAITRVVPGMLNDEVEVTNHGKTEANIEGWSISNGIQSYVFPADTILLADKHITLPYAVTKIIIPERSNISLLAPDKKTMSIFSLAEREVTPIPIITASSTSVKTTMSQTRDSTTNSIASMIAQLTTAQRQLVPEIVRQHIVLEKTNAVKQNVAKPAPTPTSTLVKSVPQTTIVITKKHTGFLAGLMALFRQ